MKVTARAHLLLTCAMLSAVIRTTGASSVGEAEGNGTTTQDATASKRRRLPLVVDIMSNIGRPGVVLYSLESEDIVRMNFTLKCKTFDTTYMVTAITSTKHVASIVGGNSFNISCAETAPTHGLPQRNHVTSVHWEEGMDNASSAGPAYVSVVSGQANMTVRTDMIGRSFLMLMAHRISSASNASDDDDDEDAGEDDQMSPGAPMGSFNNAKSSSNTATIAQGNTSGPYIAPGGSGDVHIALGGAGQGQGGGDQSPGQVLPPLPPNVVGKAMIIVMQLPRPIDSVFRVILYIVIIMATVGMGVKVDLDIVKTVLKRPTAPAIGLVCQYLGMPLIAYAIAKTIPQESAAISLGIFTCGIVPGGGASNLYCYLLGGDVSLSVTMTTLSSIAALGLIPLWIFTLGTTFKDNTVKLTVPFEKILETLAIVLLPLFVGVFIKYKLPRVAKIISKILKPVLIVVVAFLLAFGIYTNMYIFKMISPMTIAAGCLLPYIGYCLGGAVAFLLCQSWRRIKTIAIETGIQNTGIAFMIVFLSLPPPDNQLAVVGPASSAIMTPLPLLVIVIFYTIYWRWKNKHKAQTEDDEEEADDLENGSAPKGKKREALKHLVKGEGKAAIILLWQRFTGAKPVESQTEAIFNKEFEVLPPDEKSLMEKQNGKADSEGVM